MSVQNLNEYNDIMLPDDWVEPKHDKADTTLLDTRIESEYDRRNASHKLLLKLDTREGSEYDKAETFPLSSSDTDTSSLSFPCLTRESRSDDIKFMNNDIILTGCTAQGPSMTKGNETFSPSDTDTSSLSFPCLTRESSGKIDHCFSEYSRGSTNMTKGNNTLSITNEDNAPSMTRMISQSDRIPHPIPLGRTKHFPHSVTLERGIDYPSSVTLGRSETKTRGSRITNAYASAFRFAQSGRSMVEMLGVLAVIGVLSIGGIMGYSYAMDRWRANQTMRDINLRSVDVLAQYENTGDANLNAWANEKTIYPISLEDETIGIQVGEVPERVCEMMADGMADTVFAIKLNGTFIEEVPVDCAPENTMVFYFTEGDEGKENGDTGNACPEELPSDFSVITCEQDGIPVVCIMGECIPDATVFCEEGFDCPFDKGCAIGDGTDFIPIPGRECQKDGKYGRCDMSGKCNLEPDDEPLICGGVNCVEYMEELFAEIPEEELMQNGMVISAPSKECMTCVNDMCSVGEQGSGICAVDEMKICMSEDGVAICLAPKKCTSSEECPQCKSCIDGICQSGGGACTTSDGKKGVCDWYDDCYACESTSVFELGNGCTEACPNRVVSSNGEFCMLPCSGNTPLADRWGYCHTCEDEYNVPVLGDDKCSEICDNRERIDNECRPKCGVGKLADKPLYGCVGENNSYYNCYEESKTCSACGEKVYVGQGGKCSEVCPGYVVSPGGYCVPACPKDTPLMDSDGDCYACDEEDPVYIVSQDNWSSDYCSKICSNRIKKSYYCSLPCGTGINKDKPLSDYDGSCHSCDENEGFRIGYNGGKCTELCSNRVVDEQSNECVLKCGEGDLKDKPLIDSDGACLPCNVEDDVSVRYNDVVHSCSEVCSNRFLHGGRCYPKCGEGEFEGRPLLSDDGKCYACDYYDDIYVNNLPCSEVCEGRYKNGSYCYPQCGVGALKDMPLKDYLDRCYSCTTTASVIVYDGSCTTSCPNRRASGSMCYLK